MTFDRIRPPRVARAILRVLLHPDDRDCALSDLDEEFETRAAKEGPARARRWYRAQLRRSFRPAIAQRIREGPGMSHPRRALFLSGLVSDARLALRRLAARPVASLGSVATLAGSIGAAAATWSLLSSVLLHPLPVEDPDRLVVVGRSSQTSRGSRTWNAHSYPLYPGIRSAAVFDGLAAGGSPAGRVQIVAGDSAAQWRDIFFASYDFFPTLGIHMVLGRGFSAEEDRRGAEPVAILSHRFWQLAFHGRHDVVGREISVRGRQVPIVGVAPRGFRGLNLDVAPDVYFPLHTISEVTGSPQNLFAEANTRTSPTAWVTMVGRLRPNVTPEQTAERLNALVFPELGSSAVLTDVNTAAIPEPARPDMARFARLLAGAVGLLLLIGCLTVGLLLLVRTESRRDELAMCLALGATRARLARSVVLEGAWLSAVGCLLALPIAYAVFGGIRTFQLPGRVSLELLDLSLDVKVLAAAAASAVVAVLIISLAAGAFGLSVKVAESLRAHGAATLRPARRRTRGALLAAQVAIALVLMAGAGLFARSLTRALSLNPGFDTSRLLTISIGLAPHGYDATRAATFFDDLGRVLIGNPAIRSVGMSNWLGAMGPGGRMAFDGDARQVPSSLTSIGIDAQYFPTMGLRVSRGRNFQTTDVATSPAAGIVSESLGRFVANGGDPIGHRIGDWLGSGKVRDEVEIVGVVPDVISQVRTLEPLVLYRPFAQLPPDTARTILVHAAQRPDVAARELQAAIERLDPAVRVSSIQTLDEQLLAQMQPQQFGMFVLSALGGLSLLLAVVGTAVLAETSAVMRMREMGIRAALGASRRQLGRLVLAETLRLVLAGVALGLVLAWLLAETVQALLYRIEPLDPWNLASVAGAIILLALAVSLRPALVAARVDLSRMMREP